MVKIKNKAVNLKKGEKAIVTWTIPLDDLTNKSKWKRTIKFVKLNSGKK